MEWNDYRALENMMNDESRLTTEDKEYWKRAYDEEERHSDSLYQRNMNAAKTNTRISIKRHFFPWEVSEGPQAL